MHFISLQFEIKPFMNKGKITCDVLKEIRKQIASENKIDYHTHDCTFEGECRGTCPACESEVQYLENEIIKRKYLGKAVVVAGLSVGIMSNFIACTPNKNDDHISNKTDFKDSIEITNYESDSLKNKDSIKKINKLDSITYTFGGILIEPIDTISGVYHYVNTMPQFPGGSSKWEEFVRNELRYPENSKTLGLSGTVLLEFIIESDGSITNVKVLSSVYPELDEEAIRVIKSSPKWKPGKNMGKPVRVSYQIPIRFSLE